MMKQRETGFLAVAVVATLLAFGHLVYHATAPHSLDQAKKMLVENGDECRAAAIDVLGVALAGAKPDRPYPHERYEKYCDRVEKAKEAIKYFEQEEKER